MAYIDFEDCDAHFPPIPDTFQLKSSSDIREHKGIRFAFQTYERKEKVDPPTSQGPTSAGVASKTSTTASSGKIKVGSV